MEADLPQFIIQDDVNERQAQHNNQQQDDRILLLNNQISVMEQEQRLFEKRMALLQAEMQLRLENVRIQCRAEHVEREVQFSSELHAVREKLSSSVCHLQGEHSQGETPQQESLEQQQQHERELALLKSESDARIAKITSDHSRAVTHAETRVRHETLTECSIRETQLQAELEEYKTQNDALRNALREVQERLHQADELCQKDLTASREDFQKQANGWVVETEERVRAESRTEYNARLVELQEKVDVLKAKLVGNDRTDL